MKINQGGDIDWIKEGGLSVLGSFDTSVYLFTAADDGLYFSGNPSKFLQGHNVFGSLDIFGLALKTLLEINQNDAVDLGLDLNNLPGAIKQAKVTRVDITHSFNCQSRARVRNFIRAMEFKAKTRHGRSQLSGNTLYFGKNSKRWSLKFYSKGDELEALKKGHKIDESIGKANKKQLELFSDDLLRIELTLRTKELEKVNCPKVADLTLEKCKDLYDEYLGRVDMNEQIKLDDEQIEQLESYARGTYFLWRDGYDLRSVLSRPTYYRHRKLLLSCGVDIAIRCDKHNELEGIIPLIQIIEAKPVTVPRWGYEQGLVALSA